MRAQGMTLRAIVDALNAEVDPARRWSELSYRSDLYSPTGDERRRFRSSASTRPVEEDRTTASESPTAAGDGGNAP